ncbi:amine sulfotransferase-like [Amblyraja radiata]|uniref:amine sulfotransferase-like n=1 Tax=Amblyraja radiata TaxID=386614 RepID=UPI00140268B3|nr:amine sulfotransferase-like [Amblyraja radiata]XP_032877006.1 amine sulfotransferase-like [Amblyraja radiata]
MSTADNHYFQYKGCNFVSAIYKKEHLEQLEHFEIKDSDVFIVTYPKSGTIWMQQILSLIYADGDLDDVQSKPTMQRAPWIEVPNSNFPERPSPRLNVTHLPYHLVPKALKAKKGKVIYVARNPKDVLVSSYYFHKHFALYESPKNFPDFFEKFIDGRVEFSCWFDHIRDWCTHKDEFNFLFLTYEEMQKDLRATIQKICNFVGRQLDDEKLDSVIKHSSFETMKKDPMANYEGIPKKSPGGSFLRKGTVGDWKNNFTVAQSERFDKIYQERMKDLPLVFTWDKE